MVEATQFEERTRLQAQQTACKAASLERRIMQFMGFANGVDDWLRALQRAAELWLEVSEFTCLAERERLYAWLRYQHCAHPTTQILIRTRYQAAQHRCG